MKAINEMNFSECEKVLDALHEVLSIVNEDNCKITQISAAGSEYSHILDLELLRVQIFAQLRMRAKLERGMIKKD